MASADDVIAALEQARQKLVVGKTKGLQAARMLGKARTSVSHALGRAGAGSPLLSEMAAKERALAEQVMRTDALVTRVDQAIAQARGAAGGGSAPTLGSADTGSSAGTSS